MNAVKKAGGLVAALNGALPRGVPLRDDSWVARHRALVILVWAHVILIPIVALSLGYSPLHALLEASPVAAAAIVAGWSRFSRDLRMAGVTVGLVTSSAILVHLSGGLIEMHFHFFVVVAIVTLYQAWLPFLLAIAYVVLHHGVMGAIDPGAVFNHPAALAQPWRWAFVHGVFIAAASAAGLAAWRFNEDAQERLAKSYEAQLIRDEVHLQAQRQTREALERSEQRFRSLIQNSYEVVAVVTPKGLIDYISPSVESMLGYRADDLIGRVGFDFVHPEDVQQAEMTHAHVGEVPGRVGGFEIRALHADGSWRWLEVTLHNLCDNTSINGLVSHIRDVTERKLAQEASSLLEGQLRQSQKLEAVGQLAGGVAHDFNNILAVIQNYARFVIEEMDETDPSREDVAEIIAAGDRAANLVRQLLTFSRKDLIRPEHWDLNEIVGDMTAMLRRTFPENIELDVRLGDDEIPVLVDRGQMEQVIMNIAVNARDAMHGGGKLRIETAMASVSPGSPMNDAGLPSGDHAHLVFADDGAGMDPETLARIFEPFFTTKSRDSGTGLGLATVYGIVEHAGGRVCVDSEPGSGTRFDVYLPLSKAAQQRPERAPHRDGRAPVGTGTILVAEDEPLVRNVIHRLLASRGYEVLLASSGEEAIEIANEHPGSVDLLLTDLVMPKMSGIELAARLPGMRTVFMSGYSGDVLSAQGLPPEGEYMEKPFTPDVLFSKVQEALEGRPTSALRGVSA